jgi:uncharacterized protein YlxP (DUF503 family)
MVLGLLQFDLHIRGAESLKDKRRVVNSIKDRLHREHQVSVAEVARQDNMSVASMGAACIAPDGRRAAEVLDHITEKLRGLLDAELGACERKIIQFKDLPESEEAGPDPDEIAAELLAYFETGSPPPAHAPFPPTPLSPLPPRFPPSSSNALPSPRPISPPLPTTETPP